MTIIYDFYNNILDGVLYLEIWQVTPEWTEYLWSVPVSSIAHGFSVLEEYRKGGYIVKQMIYRTGNFPVLFLRKIAHDIPSTIALKLVFDSGLYP